MVNASLFLIIDLAKLGLKMSEKLCLKWNDFQDNVNSAFGALRDDKELTDVTLVCEDGEQADAHKIILSASSPFFKGLLSRNKHSHPLIYMRGVKSEDLMAIVDFLYLGEANFFQENLDSFLALAEELKLKGLMGSTSTVDSTREGKMQETISKPTQTNSRLIHKKEKIFSNSFDPEAKSQSHLETERRIAIPNVFSGNFEELDEKLKSMMETSQNLISNGRERALICKVCGKEGMNKNIKDHIEANHLEGLTLPCNLCEKTFRSRNSLRMHKRQKHTASVQDIEYERI